MAVKSVIKVLILLSFVMGSLCYIYIIPGELGEIKDKQVMAPVLKQLFKRAVSEEEVSEEPEESAELTTLATIIFGHKHLHKGSTVAPVLKQLFKRAVSEEDSEEPEESAELTTLATIIFGHKHLHKGRLTTVSTEDYEEATTEIEFKVAHIFEKTGIPKWGVVAIFVLIAFIIFGICGFYIRRWSFRLRSEDSKKSMKGVDLKLVQPDMEELTDSAEKHD